MKNNFNDFIDGFTKELVTYNKFHNITRLKDIKAAALDSVKALDLMDFKDGLKVADIGSGAGFPAIFLAFLKPNCQFYLFEPNYKKAAFLSLIKSKFNLNNVYVMPKKVEDELNLKVDLITSRAFARTEDVVRLCKNISYKDTEFLLYKGSFVTQELECLSDYQLFEFENRIFLKFSCVNVVTN